jgi:hypothetical protein
MRSDSSRDTIHPGHRSQSEQIRTGPVDRKDGTKQHRSIGNTWIYTPGWPGSTDSFFVTAVTITILLYTHVH